MRPAEIILVDDGSDDGTLDELLRLSAAHSGPPEIRVVKQIENRGAASARNTGWKVARGDYVAFLDSDDTWHPRKLEVQHAAMLRNPEAVVSGHLHTVASGLIDDLPVTEDPGVSPVGFYSLLWRNRFVTSSAIVRRSIPARFTDGLRYMEDHRLWLDIARSGMELVRVEATLAAHHKANFGAGGLSGNLLAMERAELENYRYLARTKAIGRGLLIVTTVWSLAKFVRRVLIVFARRAFGHDR